MLPKQTGVYLAMKMKYEQEVMTVRKEGIKGFLYAYNIQKYHVTKKGIKINPKFEEYKKIHGVEIVKHKKFMIGEI